MNGQDVFQLADALKRVKAKFDSCPLGNDPVSQDVLVVLWDNVVSEVARACAVRFPNFNAETWRSRIDTLTDKAPAKAVSVCGACNGYGAVAGLKCEACDGGGGRPIAKGDVT